MSDTKRFPRTLRIGILVFDGFEPLDVWGFVEAFSISRFIGTNYASPPPYPFEVVLISNQCRPDGAGKKAAPASVKSANGPRVAPDYFRDEALEKKIDVLMIPGGIGTRILLSDKHPKERKALVDWVRAMDQRVELMASVCTGAAILAFTGLLDGLPAATNHAAFAWVTSQGPRVLWDNVSRWVDAGHYVTSAGVSAGTDMAFYLVKRLAGRAVAEVATAGAEYDWHRDPEEPIFYPQQAAVPGTTTSK
ncbi:MAG TPA: DJ-1/PfpI family protein [Thermoanaerobaculia bacterium]|nr:DJ-1/PfpI family protein [Thermoanaerobaculia bacterium]